jgi:cytochrome c oxidase cbb3-type subunit I/II
MWTSGVTQGLMWRAENPTGGLMYPSFVETVIALKPMYWMRLIGGLMYLTGFIMMAWNLWATARSGAAVDGQVDVVVEEPETNPGAAQLIFGGPVIVTILALAALVALALLSPTGSTIVLMVGAPLLVSIVVLYRQARQDNPKPGASWHNLIEGRAMPFTVLTVGAILIGGIAEIVPLVIAGNDKLAAAKEHAPYTALELEGRDVFLKEGCYNCHSQMVRPFAWETARYGEPTTEKETQWDHPFQWGSKRTGPDLARLGGRYTDVWHYRHMLDPRELSPGSNMPAYAHLQSSQVDFSRTPDKLRAMRNVGVPYTPEVIAAASGDAEHAADQIATGLARDVGADIDKRSELIALISYLQRLGKSGVPAGLNQGAKPELATKGGH